MKYFVKWIALALCCVMLFSVSACANGNTDGETESVFETESDGTPESEISEGSETESASYVESVLPTDAETTTETETSMVSEKETLTETETKTEMETKTETETETEAPEITEFSEEAEIRDRGDFILVSTADGLRYLARGYGAYVDGAFTFSDTLEIEIQDGVGSDNFNRVTLCYVSSSPMLCTLTYTEAGREKNDSFFLESGRNIFSGLIESYIQGGSAKDLKRMTLKALEGESASFMLYRAACVKRRVYSDENYYLENERFKVGFRLVWGGGINYIEDKSCPVSDLGNLINIHDAGRLVQQSYYGTAGNEEYTPGVYNGSDWVYNPVQGGDQYWNHSRLIDIIVSEDSVYIKSQPQDWSLDGQITPSYMENTYTIYPDRIEVYNRFVDFSGWEHRYAHQELPAFYTVSYLDRFSYYNGLSPWTGGEIIEQDNLPFTSGEDAKQCYFKMLESNTETWCAWTNETSGYGIGLYLPNADMFLAARFADGHSKDPEHNSCSYVAPVNALKIVSFVPIEYGYMITTGNIDEIREVFGDNRDFAQNDYLSSEYSQDLRIDDVDVSYENMNFATAEHNKYLLPLNGADMKFNCDHNAIELIVNGTDPQINILYSNAGDKLIAEDFGKIVIEYMIPETNKSGACTGELFLCVGETVNAEAGKSVALNYIADGAYHTVEVELSSLEFWSGEINSIRFDFFNSGEVGDKIFIKSIRLEK